MQPVYGDKKTEEVLSAVDELSKGGGNVKDLMRLLA
jgi:hypothetical protein